jgi:hypothetical protein
LFSVYCLQVSDSQVPSLNPYFELKDNRCTGLWSEKIVAKLAKSRPSVVIETSEAPADMTLFKDGLPLPSLTVGHSRPLSIKVSSYLALGAQTGITIT